MLSENLLEELDDDVELYRSHQSRPQTSSNVATTSQQQSRPQTSSNVVTTSQHQSRPQTSSNVVTTSQRPSTSRSPAAKQQLSATSKEELQRLKKEKRCKICLDRDATMVFSPCGHICACRQCTVQLRDCPVCRKKIEKAIVINPS